MGVFKFNRKSLTDFYTNYEHPILYQEYALQAV